MLFLKRSCKKAYTHTSEWTCVVTSVQDNSRLYATLSFDQSTCTVLNIIFHEVIIIIIQYFFFKTVFLIVVLSLCENVNQLFMTIVVH